MTGTREQRRRLLPARLMVYFVLALWLFRGRNCGYGQVMAKLTDGLYCQRRGRTCWPGSLAPGGRVDAGRRQPVVAAEHLLAVARDAASWVPIRCGCCSSTWRGRPGRTGRRGCSAAGCGWSPWTGRSRTCRTARRTPRSSAGPPTSPGTGRSRRPGGSRRRSPGPAACWARRSAGAPTPSSRWPRTCWAASARACWCSRTASSCPGPTARAFLATGAHLLWRASASDSRSSRCRSWRTARTWRS